MVNTVAKNIMINGSAKFQLKKDCLEDNPFKVTLKPLEKGLVISLITVKDKGKQYIVDRRLDIKYDWELRLSQEYVTI